MNKDPFKEYIKQSEPNKRDKGYAWHTAIGLQVVDGLKTSKYLIDTAIKNIEGDISIDEAQELLNTYYEENPKSDKEDRTEEADKVAVRIAKNLLLDEKNELHNRTMHISGMFEKEVDIESVKVDIRNTLLSFSNMISEKTVNHALEIFSKCGKDAYFGRTIVENITGLKSSGASKLIKLLLDSNVIIPVTGHGKGKYRFR